MQPTIGSDSVLRATAVAAGAFIVSPSAAASFFKATQTKNVVHFKPTGGSSTKSSMPAGVSTHSETHTNVHYISKATQCTLLVKLDPVRLNSTTYCTNDIFVGGVVESETSGYPYVFLVGEGARTWAKSKGIALPATIAEADEFSGRFIKLINIPSYSPNGLIPLTFYSQKRCELRQGTEYRKSLKFTMPSRRD